MRAALDDGDSDVFAPELRDDGGSLGQVSQRLQAGRRRPRRCPQPRMTLNAAQRRFQRIHALARAFGSRRRRRGPPRFGGRRLAALARMLPSLWAGA